MGTPLHGGWVQDPLPVLILNTKCPKKNFCGKKIGFSGDIEQEEGGSPPLLCIGAGVGTPAPLLLCFFFTLKWIHGAPPSPMRLHPFWGITPGSPKNPYHTMRVVQLHGPV